MKIANLSRAKNDLSRYVAYVRRGGRVRIMVGNTPAADLVPISQLGDDFSDDSLAELERDGTVRRGTGRVPAEILRPGPKLRGEASSKTVAAEREAGW